MERTKCFSALSKVIDYATVDISGVVMDNSRRVIEVVFKIKGSLVVTLSILVTRLRAINY